jgi:hypothetical protein
MEINMVQVDVASITEVATFGGNSFRTYSVEDILYLVWEVLERSSGFVYACRG